MSLQRIKLTLWEAVDEFLKDLTKGDVCKNPSYPDDEYYRKLMSTVCEGRDDVLELIRVKPYYLFILIAYYILFHKHNLDLAEKIYNKLREFYDKYPYTFTSDEECAFEMLKEVIREFETIRQSPKEEYKGRLSIRLREAARKLDMDYGEERCSGWSALFKLLLQLHLDPLNHEKYEAEFDKVEKSLQSLKDIYEEIEDAEREDDVNYPDEDINYYILLPLEEIELSSPIYVFINNLFKNHRDNIRSKIPEKYELMVRRDVLEAHIHVLKILKDVGKYLPLLPSPSVIISSILSFIVSMIIPKIPIYSRFVIFMVLFIGFIYSEIYLAIKYYNKRINEFVDEVLLKDVYDIIWPSSRG
jgi:flagellin-specific chaperone FliS